MKVVALISILLVYSNTTFDKKVVLLPVKKTIVSYELPVILEQIAIRESGNNWKAVNLNSNGTKDWGKFQINDIAFKELYIKKNIKIPNKVLFLKDTCMQIEYALALLNHNNSILSKRGIKLSQKNQLKSWAVSAYNVY